MHWWNLILQVSSSLSLSCRTFSVLCNLSHLAGLLLFLASWFYSLPVYCLPPSSAFGALACTLWAYFWELCFRGLCLSLMALPCCFDFCGCLEIGYCDCSGWTPQCSESLGSSLFPQEFQTALSSPVESVTGILRRDALQQTVLCRRFDNIKSSNPQTQYSLFFVYVPQIISSVFYNFRYQGLLLLG